MNDWRYLCELLHDHRPQSQRGMKCDKVLAVQQLEKKWLNQSLNSTEIKYLFQLICGPVAQPV